LFHFVGPLGLWSHDDDEDAEASAEAATDDDEDAEAATSPGIDDNDDLPFHVPDEDGQAATAEDDDLPFEAFPKKARTNDNNE
jgi:hypothetical protein